MVGIVAAAVVLVGGMAFLVVNAARTEASQPGTPVADEGREHIPDTQQPQWHYPQP